jgi:hypothetical protein
MLRLLNRHLDRLTGRNRPIPAPGTGRRPDWRGWIVLAWVVVWGWAYAVMAIQARSPQFVELLRSLSRVVCPGDP